MAEQMKPDAPEEKGPGHNSAKIDVRIIEDIPKIRRLEKLIAAEKAKHIKPLTEDLTGIWQKLKADTGFSIKYMKACYALNRLTDEARDFDDDTEKREALDALLITFEAMAKGGHLDLFNDLLVAVKEDAGEDADEAAEKPSQVDPKSPDNLPGDVEAEAESESDAEAEGEGEPEDEGDTESEDEASEEDQE